MYDRALTVDPRSVEALLGKARDLVAQKNVKDAVTYYEKVIPLVTSDDEKATVVTEEARAYASIKQNGDAETQYKRAIADYPKSMVGPYAYGDYLAASGNFTQAETEWTAALGPNRDNKDALLRLGDFYLRRNQPQKSIDMYSRLVELVPNDGAALALLGEAYSANRQYDKARDSFRKAFDNGRSPAALAGLGIADAETNNFKESAQIFDALDRQAPELFKQNPQLLFVMGKTYAATNQKDKAKSAYTRFLAFVKPNTQAASEVKKMIADLSPHPASHATAKPTPKPGAKATPKPTATPH